MLWGQAEVPLFAYPRRGATRRGLSFFGASDSKPFCWRQENGLSAYASLNIVNPQYGNANFSKNLAKTY